MLDNYIVYSTNFFIYSAMRKKYIDWKKKITSCNYNSYIIIKLFLYMKQFKALLD